jgi:hypothetical protein
LTLRWHDLVDVASPSSQHSSAQNGVDLCVAGTVSRLATHLHISSPSCNSTTTSARHIDGKQRPRKVEDRPATCDIFGDWSGRGFRACQGSRHRNQSKSGPIKSPRSSNSSTTTSIASILDDPHNLTTFVSYSHLCTDGQCRTNERAWSAPKGPTDDDNDNDDEGRRVARTCNPHSPRSKEDKKIARSTAGGHSVICDLSRR